MLLNHSAEQVLNHHTPLSARSLYDLLPYQSPFLAADGHTHFSVIAGEKEIIPAKVYSHSLSLSRSRVWWRMAGHENV